MPLRYSITLILLFMILAFSRGFVLQQFHELAPFGVFHVSAEGDAGGDAGFGGGDAGGDAGFGGGDAGGDAGFGGGDAGGDVGFGGGDAGSPVPDVAPAPAPDPGGVDTTPTLSIVVPVIPIFGCMDPAATNFNPSATSQTGITCTYPPPPPIPGCTDPAATNFNPSATIDDGSCAYPPPPPIPGCTDPVATNFNPSATIDDGSCTYPPPSTTPVCTLVVAPSSIVAGASSVLSWTTANAVTFVIDNGVGSVPPAASGSTTVSPVTTTTYTGTVTGTGGPTQCSATLAVTVTPPPPPPALVCTLSASPAAVTAGSSSTLTWTTTNATSFSIDNGIGTVSPVSGGTVSTAALSTGTTFTGTVTGASGTATCTVTVTTSPPSGGGGGVAPTSGGGGGGGGVFAPNIILAALPRVNAQPLAFLYLSQIPYTGLDLGPVGTVVYWVALIGWSLALAYLVLFVAVPMVRRHAHSFGVRIHAVLNAHIAPIPTTVPKTRSVLHTIPEPSRGYSSYEGFKSYARNGALSIDDIVKGLSRTMHGTTPAMQEERAEPKNEPAYQDVEPIEELSSSVPAPKAPVNARDFTAALLEGDRAAVFAELREQVRTGGALEHLMTDAVCLLDDVYRSRIDGTTCDSQLSRIAARLDTPTLEKLVVSLATALDASYSTGSTGAKLALTRALAALGA